MKALGIAWPLLFVATTCSAADCAARTEALRGRWQTLWERLQRHGAAGDEESVYRRLASGYCEPHRAYHDLSHVEHALNELEEVRDLAQDPDAVEFALWFHDVVYEIGARNNEEESARLARETAAELHLDEAWAGRVAELILATRHESPARGIDAQLVVDIDLSILGQSPERFDAYEAAIRKEYAPVIEQRGAERFDAGRAGILKRFLSRPAIYSTDHFREKYEAQARANLKRSIERLEEGARPPGDQGARPPRE